MGLQLRFAAGLAALLALALPAGAGDTPKQGGTLTYVIPADAAPRFNAHREPTFATIQPVPPFYRVLIRVHPQNPGSSIAAAWEPRAEGPRATADETAHTS